jgi:DNA-binding transcriptional ArsR family regulator
MDGHERTAAIAKALGHPIRLQILEELREEEACVCHLEHVLGQRQAYISQQLARLREAGLVVDRREGLNVFYALADPSIGALLDAAYQSAQAIAGAEGQTLDFHPLASADSSPCPCPKCAEKQGYALTTITGDQSNAVD